MRTPVFLLLLIAGVFAAGSAVAQTAAPGPLLFPEGFQPASTADEDLAVMARPRPDYDALGVPVSSFLLFPALNLLANYDDNVRRAEADPVSDYFFTISPSFRLESQWGRHALEFYGNVTDDRYARFKDNNVINWTIGGDGRYDIAYGSWVYGDGSAAKLDEPLWSPNTVGSQRTPNQYLQYHGEFDASVQPNHLGVSATASFDRYDYLSTPIIGGGFLNNTDRDMDMYKASARAFYNFSPGYAVFLRGSYGDSVYDQYFDRAGLHRSNLAYAVDGGLDLQVTHLVSGEIYVGYVNQIFAAPLRNISGLDYSVQLDWLATPLLTVHLTGSRTIAPIIIPGASAADTKSIGLSADYEILRNLIMQVHGTYAEVAYPGLTRNDVTPDLGTGLRYLINRNLSAELRYDYTERQTNIAGNKFNDNMVIIGVNLHE